MEKSINLLIAFNFLIFFFFFISNLIFSFLYIIYNYENNPIISEIENNLNGKLLNSIEFRKSCRGDEEKLILGMWDGTIEGCECDGNILKEKCLEEQVGQGCKSLYSNDPINYTTFNSANICVKKLELNYRELLESNQVISKEENCSINFTSCGIIDTFGRKLCIKKEESCPINIINFEKKIVDFFNKSISFPKENNNSIYSNNNTDVKLLGIIKLGQYLPCINPLEKIWDYHYILEPPSQKCKTIINKKLYDERYEKISNFSINKLKLYDENSITGKLKDIDEVNLNKIENDEIYLFGGNFLGINVKELENFNYNYESLISTQNLSNKCNQVNMIFSIFFLIILALFLIFFIFKGFLGWEINENNSLLAFIILGFISYICSPITYFITFMIIFVCNIKINSILDIKLFDEFIEELIKILIGENSFNFIYSLIIIIICPFILIFLIFSYIKIYKNWDSSSDSQNKIENPFDSLNNTIIPRSKDNEINDNIMGFNFSENNNNMNNFNDNDIIYNDSGINNNNMNNFYYNIYNDRGINDDDD